VYVNILLSFILISDMASLGILITLPKQWRKEIPVGSIITSFTELRRKNNPLKHQIKPINLTNNKGTKPSRIGHKTSNRVIPINKDMAIPKILTSLPGN